MGAVRGKAATSVRKKKFRRTLAAVKKFRTASACSHGMSLLVDYGWISRCAAMEEWPYFEVGVDRDRCLDFADAAAVGGMGIGEALVVDGARLSLHQVSTRLHQCFACTLHTPKRAL